MSQVLLFILVTCATLLQCFSSLQQYMKPVAAGVMKLTESMPNQLLCDRAGKFT